MTTYKHSLRDTIECSWWPNPDAKPLPKRDTPIDEGEPAAPITRKATNGRSLRLTDLDKALLPVLRAVGSSTVWGLWRHARRRGFVTDRNSILASMERLRAHGLVLTDAVGLAYRIAERAAA